jgi:hypothetical protein
MFGWAALSLVTSVPPLVVGAMKNHNAYPLFYAFGTYGFFAFFGLYKGMV